MKLEMGANQPQSEMPLIRPPQLADAQLMHELVCRCAPLDQNSGYLYLLLADHFSRTCAVAEQSGQLTGFVSAYRHPERAATLFIWQVAVDAGWRRRGLGLRMLESLLGRAELAEIAFIETTISPSNVASRQLFERLACKFSAALEVCDYFGPEHFGNESHEAEQLYRIGPLKI